MISQATKQARFLANWEARNAQLLANLRIAEQEGDSAAASRIRASLNVLAAIKPQNP